jgi:hypothetical protein
VGRYETRTASEFYVGPVRHAVIMCENHIEFNCKFLVQGFTNKIKDDLHTTNNLNATKRLRWSRG